MPRQAVRRRQFLGIGVAATLGGSAVSCGGGGGRWRFFTPAEARIADAICEQLIPADQDPGARLAGVVNYLDLQLTGHFKKHQQIYRQGLAAVDALSQARFQKPFADLAAADQNVILLDVEKKARQFSDLILAHAMQGFYGDPRHGGNRGSVSWQMLGLPFPPVRGRAIAGRERPAPAPR
jgi:gluconate 2-dehydrogenase gamma chain